MILYVFFDILSVIIEIIKQALFNTHLTNWIIPIVAEPKR